MSYPVHPLPTDVEMYSFVEGDEVIFRMGLMGKLNNWEADAVAQNMGFAICTVTAVAGDQVSIRSENGEKDTVPLLWLIPARDPETNELRRMWRS